MRGLATTAVDFELNINPFLVGTHTTNYSCMQYNKGQRFAYYPRAPATYRLAWLLSGSPRHWCAKSAHERACAAHSSGKGDGNGCS